MHSGTLLVEATREREERKRLRKGHRRWHSTEHQIAHGGFHGGKETSLKTTPEWLRTPGYSSGDKDKASQRHGHSFGHCVVGYGGHIQGDGVVVGKERTRGTSKKDMSELKHHSTSLSERRSRGGGNISQHGKCQSPGHLQLMLAGDLCVEEEAERLSKGFGGSFQTGSNRWSSSGVRLGELLLTAPGPPSHRPRKQPWVPKPTAPLPPIRYASHTMPTQHLPHPPGYHSLRQPGTPAEPHEPHESHWADSKALLPSLSCSSWTMGSQSTQSVPRDAPRQQDPAESDGEEEPSPAFLGSLDYHDFLHISSKAKLTSSPNASLSPLPSTTTSPSCGSHNPSPETM